MTLDREFWICQANDIDVLVGIRSASIENLQLRRELKDFREQAASEIEQLNRDLKETQRCAAIFEEWKDKVEEQRQGLEIQVGDLERQRQALEQELIEIRRKENIKPVGMRILSKIRRLFRRLKEKLRGFVA